LSNWFDRVDIGIRPRQVFEGSDVNLFPFTKNGIEWLSRNSQHFTDPVWSEEERCLKLSPTDCTTNLPTVLRSLEDGGLRIKFYGRLSGLNRNPPKQVSTRSNMPRTVVVSAIIQIILFAEPMWRAFKLESLVSIVGTSLIMTVGSLFVFQATVFRKMWARDGLASLAVLSFIWAVVSGDLLAIDHPELLWAAATSIPNLIAVVLLYTPAVDQWFIEGTSKEVIKPK
jgi:hypothetical protein